MTRIERHYDDEYALIELQGEINSCTLVAAAVIRRAFKDLVPTKHIASAWWQWDAYDFLTNRLWLDECFWRQMLEHMLVKHMILKEVQKRVRGVPPTKPKNPYKRYVDL